MVSVPQKALASLSKDSRASGEYLVSGRMKWLAQGGGEEALVDEQEEESLDKWPYKAS